eukprot:SAG22_NODE_957_length_6316_cov_2.176130_7_plen_82_part_00
MSQEGRDTAAAAANGSEWRRMSANGGGEVDLGGDQRGVVDQVEQRSLEHLADRERPLDSDQRRPGEDHLLLWNRKERHGCS